MIIQLPIGEHNLHVRIVFIGFQSSAQKIYFVSSSSVIHIPSFPFLMHSKYLSNKRHGH